MEAEHSRLSDSSPLAQLTSPLSADLTFIAAAPSYQTSIPTTTKSFPLQITHCPLCPHTFALAIPCPYPPNFLHLVYAAVLKAKPKATPSGLPPPPDRLTALLGVSMPLSPRLEP